MRCPRAAAGAISHAVGVATSFFRRASEGASGSEAGAPPLPRRGGCGHGSGRRLLSNAEVTDADLDAVWFSRQSSPDVEAWELRRLSALPFALVTLVQTDATSDELEAALTQIEEDLRERTIA